MQTRKIAYRMLTVLTVILDALYAALVASVARPAYMGPVFLTTFVPGLLFTLPFLLLAWRCDCRIRAEKQHAQLIAALRAIHQDLTMVQPSVKKVTAVREKGEPQFEARRG